MAGKPERKTIIKRGIKAGEDYCEGIAPFQFRREFLEK